MKDVEKVKAYILCSFTFPPQKRAVCEIMWRNMVEPDKSRQNIIRRMRRACWISEATNIYSEYIVLIAFSQQQWLPLLLLLYLYCIFPKSRTEHLNYSFDCFEPSKS
jgi:hypothetical protein